MADAYLSFWGKARAGANSPSDWHPAAYHCLDVAAVADRLLANRPALLRRLAEALGVPPEGARRWVVMWVALHDIGKFSCAFQIKAPDYWPETLGALEQPPDARHDELGRWMLTEGLRGSSARFRSTALERLASQFDGEDWPLLVDAVAGHHGRPPDRERSFREACVGAGGFAAAAAFIDDVVALFDPPAVAPPSARAAAELTWRMASLTVVADWLGSNETWFRYTKPDRDLAAYWREVAEPRAQSAIVGAGLQPTGVSRTTGLAVLAPEIKQPTDLQRWAETVALPDGPVLAILEDVTGSGKTEAALVLAHRLMAAGRGSGLYVAMPTMATANAMFGRLQENYLRLFEGGRPSLALAHSAGWLDERFRQVRLAGQRRDIGDEAADDAGTVSAQCAAWIADDRRKTFLAEVGVGTIDQALLAILPVKHQTLRLWGLPERVLILDEVHAYDSYVSREIEALIEFQAALGGSTILLSATLPDGMKRGLTKAFAKALRTKAPALQKTDYPLATLAARDTLVEAPCRARADLCREVGVERPPDAAGAVATILAAVKQGACVAWVRNAVDDAIEAATLLREAGLAPMLFHARFAMGDRLALEDEVLKTFGRDSKPEERRGKVLVATQVIEQSLDLDFDLLVSDLAPIDLLIQRAGRLWRHTWRDRPIPGPTLCVVSPAPDGDVDAKWYAKPFPGAAYVYENHAQLWLTARALFARPSVRVPDDVRGLVDGVYADVAVSDAPASLQRSAEQAHDKNNAGREVARKRTASYFPHASRTPPDEAQGLVVKRTRTKAKRRFAA